MQNKLENIFKNKNLNTLTSQYCEVVSSALESFWEKDVKVLMQAVNDYREIRKEKLVTGVDFFTSQIKVDGHKPIIIRLSKEFIKNIFDSVLKEGLIEFRLNKITPLEVKILNGFCEFLYKKIKDILIPTTEAKLSEKSEKNINMLFMVSLREDDCSKIMISIPQDRVKLSEVKKASSFQDDDFITSNAAINLKAGSSKITLEELQNLTTEDIIILENSELSKMTLISGDIKTKFNIKLDPSLIVNFENDEEEDENYIQKYEEVKMSKNLWDDIQIEINAEFEKVKMTIGELKQISQGQIVDLGSIFDNEISLFVEDRKVAKGELIIINDRYAVRLNEVLNTAKQATPMAVSAQKPQSAPAQKPQSAPASKPTQPEVQPQASEDEDFDYSDFEK